jgi:hypothetical protein
MPQARSSGKSSTPSAKAKTTGASAKRPAARATTAKSAGASAKPPAAASTTRATRATSAKATATPKAKTTKPAPAAKSADGARSTKSTSSSTHAAEARLEAAAQRVRKLNERIIEAGKEAGETTLTSYEKALKAIAASIERRANSTEIDWISNLATTQAKFLRDVTDAWTKAARDMLKK